MYAMSVTYVTRAEYADRNAMFAQHTASISTQLPTGSKVRQVTRLGYCCLSY